MRYIVAKDKLGIHQVIDKDSDSYYEGEDYNTLIADYELTIIDSFDVKLEAFEKAQWLDLLEGKEASDEA